MIILSLLLYSQVATIYGQADESSAAAALSNAETTFAIAFERTLEAEEVGGDVSGLLTRLNEAGSFLAEAHVCYRSSNFSGAVYFAELANEHLEGVEAEAAELANSLGVELGQRLSLTMAGSVVGVFVVALIGFLGWGYVKGRFVRRVLKMRPEVIESDEHK
jgi:hypothetical protein